MASQPDEAAWLAAIVESSDDAIISTGLDGIITSWNPAAERIYGYTATEMIGKPNHLIIPPERYDEEAAVRQRIASDRPVGHYESVRIRKGGIRIDVAMTVSPLRARDGTIVGISKISRDISDEKSALATQRHVEDQLRQVIDATSDAFCALDRRWRFTHRRHDRRCRGRGRGADRLRSIAWPAIVHGRTAEGPRTDASSSAGRFMLRVADAIRVQCLESDCP